ncbi:MULTISPECIES: 4-hydroxy-tetrahydrodipicolinate synthase [Maribacter]|jgi:4-hydroxy-tetrahydrodipicolinate synthase|uniref:4-hydroxy-tetrahydrodipicolinate synthase n=1 Tax=Maribacter stanieri TaxID=440514 RepID=A0A1I6J662_9FLAO|nr:MULTISPECIES: 4-hydroxy-tetrahydrodipicolinate synthase [Maribacter]SFR74474.1 4-hydroxy-tetrahydrodipicolinate synthase [Maribacter stanieri]|tara:strand:- start:2197 stop:3087 length:891 start_codon:yes stop_codon:yes gene_type:complete
MKELRGAGVALITPFTEDGHVDVEALKKVVAFNIESHIDYLVVLGTTAESVTLSKAEKQLVMRTVEEANAGVLPLVIGIGGNNTMALVEELQSADLSAYDAILSVSPYYNRPTQEGIYQHFAALAQVSPLPIIVYNVPGRTGSNMLPETVVRLAKKFENIVAVKEACGDMTQVQELISKRPAGFLVLSGDDITALPTIVAGGDGVISVIGQGLPEEFSKMVHEGLDGNTELAYSYHYKMQEGMKLIFEEGNPAGIKVIFEYLGLAKPFVRLPLITASDALKHRIVSFMETMIRIPA